MALATLQQLAGYIRRDLSPEDAYTGDMLLNGVSDLITEYCGWHIWPSITDTVTVDGSGCAIQPLPTLRLTALSSVTENGVALNVDNLDWSTNGLVEKVRGGIWTRRRRAIVANITHGYDQVPWWLVTLACCAAGRALVTPIGTMSEGAGGEQATYATSYTAPPATVILLDAEKQMLNRLRVLPRP